MRLFLGIELPDETKETLFGIQQEAIPYIEKGRFHELDNFHLTLRYLGETSEDLEATIKELMSDIASTSHAFTLHITHWGIFPKKNRFIVWNGLEDSAPLYELYHSIEEKLVQHTPFEAEDRSYTPHITLARNVAFKSSAPLDKLNQLVPFSEITFEVNYLTLFESTQIDGVLHYLPIYRVPLRTKKSGTDPFSHEKKIP